MVGFTVCVHISGDILIFVKFTNHRRVKVQVVIPISANLQYIIVFYINRCTLEYDMLKYFQLYRDIIYCIALKVINRWMTLAQ